MIDSDRYSNDNIIYAKQFLKKNDTKHKQTNRNITIVIKIVKPKTMPHSMYAYILSEREKERYTENISYVLCYYLSNKSTKKVVKQYHVEQRI